MIDRRRTLLGIALLCSALTTTASTSKASTPVDVTVSSVTGYMGMQVTVAVEIANGPITTADSIYGYQFRVQWNVAELVINIPASEGPFLGWSSGYVSVVVASTRPLTVGAPLAKLVFTLVGAPGSSSAVEVLPIGGIVFFSDDENSSLTGALTPGIVTVSPNVGSEVSGTMTTRTWTGTNSPYRVTGTITVPIGNTLTIEPGVDVFFNADVQFVVQGRLRAVGTETDSIRFIKGNANEWGGIRISGGDSSTMAFTRISGAVSEGRGGGIGVSGPNTQISLKNAVINRNSTAATALDGNGGGISISDGAKGFLLNCSVTDNKALSHNGGGIAVGANSVLSIERTLIAKNSCTEGGGGIVVNGAGRAILEKCTIADNLAGVGGASLTGGGGLFVDSNSPGTIIHNCVIWGNLVNEVNSSTAGINYYTTSSRPLVTYSDIQHGWFGTGNISADPFFFDAATGDYNLMSGSPCINAGDPDSPPDLDNTRSDMGAFSSEEGLSPAIIAPVVSIMSGKSVLTPIHATGIGITAVDLMFRIDTTLIRPTVGAFIQSSAFPQSVESVWRITGDVVRISFSVPIADAIMLVNEPIAFLAFDSVVGASGVSTIEWLPFPETSINEEPTAVFDGEIIVRQLPRGDADSDGEVTAIDASLILRYVVQIVAAIDTIRADVTGNGRITSYDASHVLSRVVDPDHVFPVERTGYAKQAPFVPPTLFWYRDSDDWELMATDATEIEAGDLVLCLPPNGNARVLTAGVSAFSQSGNILRVAFVRPRGTEGVTLLRVEGATRVPEIVEAAINEIPVAVKQIDPVYIENAPNPFNPSTTIRFTIPSDGEVTLAIFDANGRVVRHLIDGNTEVGYHTVAWDGRDDFGRSVASGVYVCRLRHPEGTRIIRMTMVR